MNDVIKPLPSKDGEEPPPPSSSPAVPLLVITLVVSIAATVFTIVVANSTSKDLKEQFAEERKSFHRDLARFDGIENKYEALKAEVETAEKAKRADERAARAKLSEYGADTMVCKVAIMGWTSRIEGAAGMRSGQFKRLTMEPGNPLRHITKDQGRRLLAAVGRWPYPACAGLSPFGRGK